MEYRSKIELLNIDCMEYMAGCRDNEFDLAIVDPPYGMRKSSSTGGCKLKGRALNTGDIHSKWDIAPGIEYFDELFRVSKNQIIWGGNYFGLRGTRGFVVWDKEQPFENFSDAEYAWTSFDTVSRIFRLAATRTGDDIKIHPTQKPVKLYRWLLHNYAKDVTRILDTHLGSGSIAIACDDMGFDLVGCEIDKDYFEAAKKRLDMHRRQINMF